MEVLHAASELYPLVSTGGLSSVVRALPHALNKRKGIKASVVIPLYGAVRKKLPSIEWLNTGRTFLGEEYGVGTAILDGLQVFFIARDDLFERNGIYGPYPGDSWPDNPLRFSFFSRAVASLGGKGISTPDVIHCHDWQTALVPVYTRNTDTATVLTIHNLQFQGRFGRESYHVTGLNDTLYSIDGIEFWGDWNCLKGGILFADQVTTVSPGYAREIQTAEHGFALDGVLRHCSHKLTGILNGIDTDLWNPMKDSEIPASFQIGKMKGKRACKSFIRKKLGLKGGQNALLTGMVTRLTAQKGIDTVLDSLDLITADGSMLVVLGTGEGWAESALKEASAAKPSSIAALITYDDSLARLIFAGADAFLMPSVFEPCGLGQMMAMRYGTVPLVRSVGGLSDTVNDRNGFAFTGDAGDFREAFKTMKTVWEEKRKWAWIRRRCMETDFSWGTRVDEYLRVYSRALERSG